MGVFTTLLRQILSNRDRRNSSSSGSQKGRKKKKESSSSKSLLKEESILSQTTGAQSTGINGVTSSKQSSKEGYSFKYSESGRRYHGYDDAVYIFPNDDEEADRLHQQHWILKYALKCNYHAPVTKMLEEGITVLDSGCGPATWTLEMGKTYSASKFHGIDITGVFPDTIMPANVEFAIGNIAKTLPYPDNTFDYIHQRLLIAGLTNDNWESAMKEAYRVLKPGGYIELAELDVHDPINLGPLFTKLQGISLEMFKSWGLPTDVCAKLEGRLVNNGFVNQVSKVTPLALNHSGKAGELLWDDYKTAALTAQPLVAKFNSEWNDTEVHRSYIESCGEEAKKYRTCINWYACYGQKPLQ